MKKVCVEIIDEVVAKVEAESAAGDILKKLINIRSIMGEANKIWHCIEGDENIKMIIQEKFEEEAELHRNLIREQIRSERLER